MDIHRVAFSILTIHKVCTCSILKKRLRYLRYYPLAEQKFHETITPSLAQGVEHLTLWSNLPAFVLPDVKTSCTSDTFTMEAICSDILEQVQPTVDSPSQLMVIAIAVQLSSDRKVKAIQIRKDDCNIVFNVGLGFFTIILAGQ